MPTPPPISRQFERSSGVPCKRRGHHASGAEIERPSDSSAVIASPVMVTVSARTINACSGALLDLRHVLGIQQFVQPFFGEFGLFAGYFADGLACLVGLFGDLGRFVVADYGGEGR